MLKNNLTILLGRAHEPVQSSILTFLRNSNRPFYQLQDVATGDFEKIHQGTLFLLLDRELAFLALSDLADEVLVEVVDLTCVYTPQMRFPGINSLIRLSGAPDSDSEILEQVFNYWENIDKLSLFWEDPLAWGIQEVVKDIPPLCLALAEQFLLTAEDCINSSIKGYIASFGPILLIEADSPIIDEPPRVLESILLTDAQGLAKHVIGIEPSWYFESKSSSYALLLLCRLWKDISDEQARTLLPSVDIYYIEHLLISELSACVKDLVLMYLRYCLEISRFYLAGGAVEQDFVEDYEKLLLKVENS
ncbi:MAG: hypothetical protein K8R88_13795 [Armatimonadetes bacterium]|nr:hypothetical protein [Armatimonadota bacterium]